MNRILRDVKETGRVIRNTPVYRYNRVYASSNEDLKSLFSSFDIKGKNVLSVLASGDQVFHPCSRGAMMVDYFDINKLSYYYFYLRLWNIRYNKKYYIPDRLNLENVRKLLEKVIPSNINEENALKYFKKLLTRTNETEFRRIFVSGSYYYINENKLHWMMRLYKKLEKSLGDFYHMNLMDKITIDGGYDIIYTSNIHDYVYDSKFLSTGDITIYRDNLYNLLNDNGIFIGSNVISDSVRYF